MYPDYHIHTTLSDGKSTHDEIVQAAIDKGLSEIGFSDHISIHPSIWHMDFGTIPIMVEKVAQQISKTSNLTIKRGAEVDFYPNSSKQIAELIRPIPLDYTIGSVHYIGDWNFDGSPDAYHQIDLDAFYKEYFRLLGLSAKSGLFDIMGHCDLAKKFNFKPSIKLDRLYEETAKIFADYGVVFEVNTSGRDKPCAEFYPAQLFIEILHYYKVPVTLGSDSHFAKNVGNYFNDAAALLKQIGYMEISTFTQHKRSTLEL